MSKYDNSGGLWKNDDRRNEKDPSHKGQATIDGVEYWVSAWVNRESEGRRPVVSLRFTSKESQKQSRAEHAASEFDDGIPY